MRRSIALSLLAVPLIAAAPVPPASGAEQDVRCLLIGNVFATAEKDPARKQLAFATSLYFLGRIDARLSPAQLRTQLVTQGKALEGQDNGKVMTACAQQFQAKERALQAMGRDMTRTTPPAK